jgi:hypothetical protein
MVVSLMVAVRPQRRTCEPSSAKLQRDNGSPSLAGSSQAMALTRTTSSGGKDPRSTGSWAIIETPQAPFEEALTPHADDLASGGEVICNLVVRETAVSEKDHLGADDLIIRQRILVRPSRQLPQFLSRQQNAEWADSWHWNPLRRREEDTRGAPIAPSKLR